MDGVVGRLLSSTVSRPECELAPREAGVLKPDWGGERSGSSSFVPVMVAGSGPDIILFIEVLETLSFSAFFRDAVVAGGGDLSLGDVGHEGELWPDLFAPPVPSSTPSTPGNICGLGADMARKTAAAEGTDDSPEGASPRLGLSSWLFLRERLACGILGGLREGRTGEVSRECGSTSGRASFAEPAVDPAVFSILPTISVTLLPFVDSRPPCPVSSFAAADRGPPEDSSRVGSVEFEDAMKDVGGEMDLHNAQSAPRGT